MDWASPRIVDVPGKVAAKISGSGFIVQASVATGAGVRSRWTPHATPEKVRFKPLGLVHRQVLSSRYAMLYSHRYCFQHVDMLTSLLEELTLRLLETDDSSIKKVKDLSRFINMIILRLFATGRRMSIFR